MKTIKFLSVFVLLTMSVVIAKSQTLSNFSQVNLFSTKFTKDNVWDVQRSPAYPVVGSDWTLSGLKNALDAGGKPIDWGTGRYVMFAAELDNANGKNSLLDDITNKGIKQNISLKLYESNGTLVKIISKWGKIIGVGSEGFMYEVEGMYGSFFTQSSLTTSSTVKYKPTVAAVTKMSELMSATRERGARGPKNDKIELDFFKAQYTKDNVKDAQRSPAYPVANQNWVLSGLGAAFDGNGGLIDWGVDRYVMFSSEIDNSNNPNSILNDEGNKSGKYTILLKLYEKNGTFVKTISNNGKIIGLYNEGFMYESNGIGTFFSTKPLKTTSITCKPVLAVVTKLSELRKVAAVANNTVVETVVTNNNSMINTSGGIVSGYYTLTARCSGKVLDVLDASTLDGAKIQQWSLNGNIAQHWKIDAVANAPGYYTLTARCSGKVLDVLDGSKLDGGKIQQWSLNGNIAQHWKIEPVAGAPGYFILTARCSGKVLDVLDGSKLDGGKIQQWKLNGNIAQHWKLDLVK